MILYGTMFLIERNRSELFAGWEVKPKKVQEKIDTKTD